MRAFLGAGAVLWVGLFVLFSGDEGMRMGMSLNEGVSLWAMSLLRLDMRTFLGAGTGLVAEF